MKIAILSDTHKKSSLMIEAIEMLKKDGATFLLHAGDLENRENLDILDKCGLKYISVFGNNDYNIIQYQNEYNIFKEPYYFKLANLKFKLMHLPFYMSGDTDIIIFGHTHYFESEYKNGTLFLNPGEICARNKNLTECVLLEITDKKYIIKQYFKSPANTKWDYNIIEYERG